jgi:hypothetical protein
MDDYPESLDDDCENCRSRNLPSATELNRDVQNTGYEVNMAQSRQAIKHARKAAKRATAHVPRGKAERTTDHVAREPRKAAQRWARGRERATQNGARDAESVTHSGAEALRQQTERIGETGHEGTGPARETSAAAITRAGRISSGFADGTQEIVGVWERYAQDLLHNSSEAREALFRARTLTAMMQVQANLMRGNLQSFFSHWSRLTDVATRLGLRPLEAFRK